MERTRGVLLDNQLPSKAEGKSKLFYGYVMVIAAFLAFTVMFGTQYSFGVFFKPVLNEFGWTRAMTSGAYALYIVMHGVGNMLAGRLTDRFGPRLVVTGCGILLGLGYLLMSRVDALWQFYVFYGVLASLGMSSYVPLMSTVARWFTRRRGLMTGIVVSGIGVGTIIMPPVANRLISNYNWRPSYIIVGALALVTVIIIAQFLKRDPATMGLLPYGASSPKENSPHLESRGLSAREALRTPQFWLVSFVYFAFLFSEHGILVHIVPHATDMGISTASAAGVLSLIGAVGIAGRVSIGIACDRIGSKKSLAIVFVLMTVGLLWLQAARELWSLYLFAVVYGFGYGASIALESMTVAEMFGTKAHGAIMGVVVSVSSFGGASGPLLAGQIYDLNGSYFIAFLVYGVVTVIGLALALVLRPPIRNYQ
ncbi:MAG: MFS transporter [Chloroflexi bacterium]|nr:MFS transporter [Chloroflexota bacterium]